MLGLQGSNILDVSVTHFIQFLFHARRGFLQLEFLAITEDFDAGVVELVHALVGVVLLF